MVLGFFKITPELMGLGYATGKAVQPDHTGKSLPIFSAKLINRAPSSSISHVCHHILVVSRDPNAGADHEIPR